MRSQGGLIIVQGEPEVYRITPPRLPNVSAAEVVTGTRAGDYENVVP